LNLIYILLHAPLFNIIKIKCKVVKGESNKWINKLVEMMVKYCYMTRLVWK